MGRSRGSFSLEELGLGQLHVPGAQIVRDRYAEHIVLESVGRHRNLFVDPAPKDERELDLVVEQRDMLRPRDGALRWTRSRRPTS